LIRKYGTQSQLNTYKELFGISDAKAGLVTGEVEIIEKLVLPKDFKLLHLANGSDPDVKAAWRYVYSRGLSDKDVWYFKLGVSDEPKWKRRVIMPSFDNTGNLTAPGTVSATTFTGNGGGLSNVATKVEGSWTLASGTNTVNISVPLNGTYTIWVNGNIPNGIITYTATAVVTNTNVPVLGEQYGWYYAVGNALVLTSIPNQFTGTVGSISNVNTYLGNTANVFTFGITNNSGNTAVVNYGYTKL
jgi:hypothetical protein